MPLYIICIAKEMIRNFLLIIFFIFIVRLEGAELNLLNEVSIIDAKTLLEIEKKDKNILLALNIKTSKKTTIDVKKANEFIILTLNNSIVDNKINKLLDFKTNIGQLSVRQREEAVLIALKTNATYIVDVLNGKSEKEKNIIFYTLNHSSNVLNTKTKIKPLEEQNKQVINNLDNYQIDTFKYIILMLIMAFVVIILYFVRKKLNKGNVYSDIKILQVKILDSRNKIIVISHKDKDYILGVNSNSITYIDSINHNDLNNEKTNEAQDLSDTSKQFKNLLQKYMDK